MKKRVSGVKNSGVRLWNKAKKVIPGGGQLLSKRSEMFLPGGWPSYYRKAKGAEIWDLDGRHYFDMSIMGIGSCILGYANDAVNRAVKKAVDSGNMATLNCPEEPALAEKLIALHPWAGMARFARTGGEACAIAVRIARAASGRDKVLFCGYHGWADWYLASNLSDSKNLDGQLLPGLEPKGVPRALRGTAIPFHYGDVAELRKRVEENKGEVGVIIMEVQRQKADRGFLAEARRLATAIGAVLVFDEITSGFRLRAGGAHPLYGVNPDIVLLGKAMGNGYPIAAIVGKKEVMNAAQETFISSTYWTERVGFAAALEVIRQYEKRDIPAYLAETGGYFSENLVKVARSSGLELAVSGMAPAPHLEIPGKDSALVETYFTQEMLRRGYLASNLTYLSTAHTKKMIDGYLREAAGVFDRAAKLRKSGSLEASLPGGSRHTGFKRLA